LPQAQSVAFNGFTKLSGHRDRRSSEYALRLVFNRQGADRCGSNYLVTVILTAMPCGIWGFLPVPAIHHRSRHHFRYAHGETVSRIGLCVVLFAAFSPIEIACVPGRDPPGGSNANG
jgi:hypothetical protein